MATNQMKGVIVKHSRVKQGAREAREGQERTGAECRALGMDAEGNIPVYMRGQNIRRLLLCLLLSPDKE